MQGFFRSVSDGDFGPEAASKAQPTTGEESLYADKTLRKGTEKVVLITLCASSTLALVALVLGTAQFSTICDLPLVKWNLGNAVYVSVPLPKKISSRILSLLSAASVAALYYGPAVMTIISRLVRTADFAEVTQHGTPALMIFLSLLLL
ncbi:conserved hypothetical protein [Neospora caninum Liverpool]|uniref:Uncharacterized protein n=1 Tax=Neospora caninum (strain Liverpool) TaxID=572307 RepID=F0VKQ1_NEOCL|nr:conserved hypothetical protein [Neospora caninum Liverpool]CBZ54652.1 conserved hypothetical protein [Neospora caninum Liverpool]CEL69369.1 TPA: hypothetical protein BN1204_050800 [Neospora caninum Liverpool]|eukprot:XP_003884682.1 conserved hypothetical protein [Neospora caninum Liverpool]